MLLMGGFLNQDWPLDYPTIWAAADQFMLEEDGADVAQAATELREVFLSRPLSEEQLDQMLTAYSCAYYAPGHGLTYREWLVELEKRLTRS